MSQGAQLASSQTAGLEWIVEAHGCNPGALTDLRKMEDLFRELVREFGLRPLGKTQWHQFARTGGITGMCMLAESHFACHTFPEYGSMCLNLFCCKRRDSGDFVAVLKKEFDASRVEVRTLERHYCP
jgi:S-adenosylmethionine decarboxylase